MDFTKIKKQAGLPRLTCDDCGQFVSYADLESGKATRYMDTPDSEFTSEKYVTLCRTCLPKDQRRIE